MPPTDPKLDDGLYEWYSGVKYDPKGHRLPIYVSPDQPWMSLLEAKGLISDLQSAVAYAEGKDGV